jgi:hypothetical protein
MRQTFDQNTQHEVALSRARDSRKVGRKHNHQPRGRALEKRHRAKLIRAKQRELARIAFSAKVAAYFRGEIDGYPTSG